MRDDPPGIDRMERQELLPKELNPEDFTDVDGEGEPMTVLPPELPFDEATCDCGASIGFRLDEGELGRTEHAWTPTWQTSDGTYVCEDCATAEIEVAQEIDLAVRQARHDEWADETFR